MLSLLSRVGGWSEDWRVMLNSTQDQIKLKLKFELSLAIIKNQVQTIYQKVSRIKNRITSINYQVLVIENQ